MVGAGAHGHINPNLPVIAELVARGHRVRYAVPAAFAELVASSGATPLRHTSVLPDETAGERWPDDAVVGMTLFLDEGRHVTPRLERALDDDRPDLFLADIGGYAARVLGLRWGVPCVQLSPAMVAWEGFERDTGMADLFATPEGEAYLASFAAWLAEEGVDLAPLTFTGAPDRSIILIPRALQPYADKVDARRYTFVGPCLDAREHQGEWDEPVDVLVSLGSAYVGSPEFWRRWSRRSATAGGWCSRSGATSTPPIWARCPTGSPRTRGCRSSRSCGAPPCSSRTPAWAAAPRAWRRRPR